LSDKNPGKLVVGTILIVEDDITLRWLLGEHLHLLGYDVHAAANGREAVDQTRIRRYQLILMDLNMPVMNGYEATESIRSFETANHFEPVPIFAVSSHPEPDRCLASGMTGFLQKPISRSELKLLLSENKNVFE
jgi:CheY-like chemotaxis protein